MMQALEDAILRTVVYADIFNFPLTIEEIHHFLMGEYPASRDEIQQTLRLSHRLAPILKIMDQYVIYKGRIELIEIRRERERASQYLWPQAEYWGRWLSALPFVRMVALTGALAVRNAADDDDDLDYLLVTAPHRVWLARAFAIAVVRIGRLHGVEICPNYVLAETSLTQTRQDIFMAHEVAQMIPLYGHDYYRQFREANKWVYRYLPNAIDPMYDIQPFTTFFARTIKALLEMVCGGAFGNWLEQWEYRRKLRRFASDLQTPHSSARVDETQVKGHFNDHGHPVLLQYDQRLRECGLSEEPLASTGD